LFHPKTLKTLAFHTLPTH